jgi:hypothetical protein
MATMRAVAPPARAARPRRALLVAAATLGLATTGPAAFAGPANAPSFTLELACADGQHYTVTVLEPTPDTAAVHVVDGTSVIVPTSFRWHVLVTDAAGDVLDESGPTPEPVHGTSGERLDTVECTFTQWAHHDWPDVGPVTIEVDGTVEAFLPR